MNKRTRDKILVRFYQSQDRYERVASLLHRILDEDERFPSESVYTVKHRLKNEARLIDKIDGFNATLRKGTAPIDEESFERRIDDLLGMRIVCLRLADLEKVKEYLQSLAEEGRVTFVKGPTEKKTFLIRPGDLEPHGRPDGTDMQYSGYSSIHYVVKLGRALRPPPELVTLKAELQLRTILEEAWGEIDHKYRYELTRAGQPVPPHIDVGFRDLSLYLQAAARQADHLCEEVEALAPAERKMTRARRARSPKAKEPDPSVSASQPSPPVELAAPALPPPPPPQTLPEVFEICLGFVPTQRTLAYCSRRLAEHGSYNHVNFGPVDLYHELLQILGWFTKVYREVLKRDPFTDADPSQRDLDVVPLVNFAIFSSIDPGQTAEAGLRATLRRRTSPGFFGTIQERW